VSGATAQPNPSQPNNGPDGNGLDGIVSDGIDSGSTSQTPTSQDLPKQDLAAQDLPAQDPAGSTPVWTRSALANFLGGTLEGADGPVTGIANPEEAQANDVVAARHEKYLEPCLTSQAGLIMLGANSPVSVPVGTTAPALLRVPDPEVAWERLLSAFAPQRERPTGIDPSASIHPSAQIGTNVHIGPNVTVSKNAHIGPGTTIMAGSFIGEGSSLGSDCELHPNVNVLHHVRLGNRVLVQAGAIIGADGFGFRRTPEHQHVRLPHIGTVVIEDDVEIGANSVVDRGTIGETRIGARSKLGAACIVAHNSILGQDVLLIGAVQMGGSTILEDRVTLWGQVGVAGHLRIGAGSVVTAQSGVSKSLPAAGTFRGSPARPVAEFARSEARVRDLERLRERVNELEALELEVLAARVLELERKLEPATEATSEPEMTNQAMLGASKDPQ
jgi:UDP-3-O-[3-hydroxymyristoyl] glucosamine N-acyltransferase